MKAIKTSHVVQQLRNAMGKIGLDAYIVPTPDPHASEYIPPYFGRRTYLTGFSGSYGTAIVTAKEAVLWTDGRYTVQAKQQMESDVWSLQEVGVDIPMEDWLLKNLPDKAAIGYDPWVYTVTSMKKLVDAFNKKKAKGLQLKPIEENLIDPIWDADEERKRAPFPQEQAFIHEVKFTGKTVAEKLEDTAKLMKEKAVDQLVLTALDEVAWVLNLRGSDVPFNPVFFAYVIVRADATATLFIDDAKLTDEVRAHLAEGKVEIQGYADIAKYITETQGAVEFSVDPAVCNQAILQLLETNPNVTVSQERSFVTDLKAIKNPVELDGMRACHIRDGAAVVKYIVWLGQQIKAGNEVTENSGADHLESLRQKGDLFVGLSFNTISAVGPNAAMPHYDPRIGDNSKITDKEIYLVDSGAQYYDGTTDITRTVHFGTPTDREKEAFTRVLKGHIALDRLHFPTTAIGNQLDTVARVALWEVGWDFSHGTGHGVGHFLCVHEGPHRVGVPRPTGVLSVPMKAGMITSNEPGYYEAGNFGIRIENLVIVADAESKYGDKGKWLTCEAITLVPMQQSLIDFSMLTGAEVEWLNTYHAKVLEKVGPLVKDDEEVYKWLEEATKPASK